VSDDSLDDRKKSHTLHFFSSYFCIVNQTFELFPPNGEVADSELARLSTNGAQEAKRELITKLKNKKMKRRIIYVGTLIDLAAMFEPDEKAESIEVTNIIKHESYE
jgi:hypothetical protein